MHQSDANNNNHILTHFYLPVLKLTLEVLKYIGTIETPLKIVVWRLDFNSTFLLHLKPSLCSIIVWGNNFLFRYIEFSDNEYNDKESPRKNFGKTRCPPVENYVVNIFKLDFLLNIYWIRYNFSWYIFLLKNILSKLIANSYCEISLKWHFW